LLLHRALQLERQGAIGSQQLKPPIDARHRTDRHETSTRALRQAIDERFISGRAVTQIHLLWRRMPPTNGTAIETHVIGRFDPRTQGRHGAVDRESTSSDPGFDFAPRA